MSAKPAQWLELWLGDRVAVQLEVGVCLRWIGRVVRFAPSGRPVVQFDNRLLANVELTNQFVEVLAQQPQEASRS